MMSRKKWIIAAFVGGLLTMASAQEGIQSGDTVFKPYVEGEYAYDDNLFQTATGQDDSYWQYVAGAELSHATDALLLGSTAWFSQRFYDQYTQKDVDSWGASGRMRFSTDKSSVTASLGFLQVEDHTSALSGGSEPPGFEGTVGRVFDRSAPNRRRQITDLGLDAAHRLSDDMGLSVAYGFYKADYEDNALPGWYEHSIGSELSFQLTDKTISYLNVEFAAQESDGIAQNGKITTAHLGLKNKLTDKSTVRFGLGVVHYKSNTEEYTLPSFEAEALWQTTEKVAIFVKGRNGFQPMANGQGAQSTIDAGGGVRIQMIDSLALTVSGALDYGKQMDGAEAETLQKIGLIKLDYTSNIGLGLFASAEYATVEEDIGSDYNRFRTSIGARYTF